MGGRRGSEWDEEWRGRRGRVLEPGAEELGVRDLGKDC